MRLQDFLPKISQQQQPLPRHYPPISPDFTVAIIYAITLTRIINLAQRAAQDSASITELELSPTFARDAAPITLDRPQDFNKLRDHNSTSKTEKEVQGSGYNTFL